MIPGRHWRVTSRTGSLCVRIEVPFYGLGRTVYLLTHLVGVFLWCFDVSLVWGLTLEDRPVRLSDRVSP